MFEAAEVGHKISKAEAEAEVPQLRVDLVNAQYDLRETNFPVIMVIAGDDRIGCNELLHHLYSVMDGRYLQIHALGRPTDEELERPRFWRYWRCLPRRGQIGVFLGAWPIILIRDYALAATEAGQFERRIDTIRRFEQSLVDDGALLLKFWLHLPKQAFKKRLQQAKKQPDKGWQLNQQDWIVYKAYDNLLPIAERVVRETSTGAAPWHIVESTDARYRDLAVGRMIREKLLERLAAPAATGEQSGAGKSLVANGAQYTILDTVDLSRSLSRSAYQKQLQRYQARLSRLTRKARAQEVSSVLVFEGWDAAGKGGVIRRITAAIDPENLHVIPIAAPSEEEQAHHYLWRFWHHLPRAGRVLIFDRSWYGRVLVERVEGFATDAVWQRAYSEINDFEAQLCEHGILLLKFWLHIEPQVQLERFQARQQTAYKKYKINEEDYRNRGKWQDYVQAVHEMVARTSTEYAPWQLIAANDKPWARIQALKAFCHGLKRLL
jgi:polyphosphate:AMP phosphotransferase